MGEYLREGGCVCPLTLQIGSQLNAFGGYSLLFPPSGFAYGLIFPLLRSAETVWVTISSVWERGGLKLGCG